MSHFSRLFKVLAAFILISNASVAQELTVSPEINEPGYDHLKVIGQDTEGYFVLISNLNLENPRDKVGLKTRKTKLLYFDTSLKMQWSVPVKTSPEGSELEALVTMSRIEVKINPIHVHACTALYLLEL